MRSESSFDGFWLRERDPIRRALTFTLGDAELAADCVDEAMVRAFVRWHRVGHLEDPAGWVFHVAMNVARSALRKRRLRPTFDPADPGIEARAPSTDLPVPAVELWEAVAALPIQQRAVVVLRFYLDWPLERIAGAVKAPVGTVKSRLHRALHALEHLEVAT